MTDVPSDRTKDLAAFANSQGQRNQPIGSSPGGHALVRPTSGIADRVIGAQPVAVHRDEAAILQKLSALAAAAGSDWFYRFPVKKKEGGQDWIEGPSIKLANDVARIFGNNVNEVREVDVGDAWVFYARFTDIETGFSYERAYRQRKSQGSMRTRDADRSLDIAYQIGQSKAIRNCICNALQIYCDYAFEQAQNSLVEKIGSDLPAWRKRTLEGLARMPVDVVRVERVIGRASKDWLAPDVARIVAMMRSVHDGMATLDETFPPPEEVSAPPAAPSSSTAAGGSGEGGGGEQKVPDPGESETGDTVSDTQVTQSAATGAHATAVDPPVAQNPAVVQAYERGRQAKKQGVQRRAVPGEYREASASAQAAAWIKGWDGVSI